MSRFFTEDLRKQIKAACLVDTNKEVDISLAADEVGVWAPGVVFGTKVNTFPNMEAAAHEHYMKISVGVIVSLTEETADKCDGNSEYAKKAFDMAKRCMTSAADEMWKFLLSSMPLDAIALFKRSEHRKALVLFFDRIVYIDASAIAEGPTAKLFPLHSWPVFADVRFYSLRNARPERGIPYHIQYNIHQGGSGLGVFWDMDAIMPFQRQIRHTSLYDTYTQHLRRLDPETLRQNILQCLLPKSISAHELCGLVGILISKLQLL